MVTDSYIIEIFEGVQESRCLSYLTDTLEQNAEPRHLHFHQGPSGAQPGVEEP